MLRSCLIFIMFLTACSKFVPQKVDNPVDGAFFTPGESTLIPSTDKLSDSCFSSVDFDACIFLKNPVAQEKRALDPGKLDQTRKFGVKIRGLSSSGFLENGRVQVFSLFTPRFNLLERNKLKSESAGGLSYVEQFSAYYWANRVFDYLEPRLGAARLAMAPLKIYADDAFTGYASGGNSIHLQREQNSLPKAYSGEVVVYLVGQALANSLSGQKVFTRNPAQHNFCALDPKGCCTTENGCAQSLANAFGEYLAAVMFPDSARVGEAIANATAGQKICEVPRALGAIVTKTKTEVFNACAPAGRTVLMGAWYASLWWKLRAQLDAQEPGSASDVDALFFDHAKVWTSTSTFAEAKTEALRLAGEFKGGKYLVAFQSAFSGI